MSVQSRPSTRFVFHFPWRMLALALSTIVVTATPMLATSFPKSKSPGTGIGAASLSQSTGAPIGALDVAVPTSDGQVEVIGWAADQRLPGGRIDIHVYVFGPDGHLQGYAGFATSLPRADVAAAHPWAGARQGFRAVVPALTQGSNTVCAYALNPIPGGSNSTLGCRTAIVSFAVPVGFVDSVAVAGSTATVSGWTFDPIKPATSISVHIYVNSPSGSKGVGYVADDTRPDVNRVYSISGRHGFSRSVELSTGMNSICAYGIGSLGNALIGRCWTVRLSGDVVSGFPTPATTGPRSSATATQGSISTSTNGQVIERLTVNGQVTIQHDNVTVRDVTVMGTGTYMIYIRPKANGQCPTNVQIEYVEINGQNAPASAIAVYGAGCGFTFDHGEIRNTGKGLRLTNNATVSNSYVYTARTWDGAHRTAIGNNGGSNLRVINNALYCELTGCSSAVSFYGDFAQVDNVLIQGNLMSTTGRYCIHGGSVSSKPYPDGTNVRILDNHFSTSLGARCGVSGPVTSFDDGVRGNQFSGNIWHETGQPATR
jgi:hypothetical protein